MSDERATNSRFREIALRGKKYREEKTYPYFGEDINLFIKPVLEKELLPLQTLLMEKLGMDLDDAEEEIEGAEAGDLDERFIEIMQEIALRGICTEQGDAEGEDREGLRQILGAEQEATEEEIGLVGGLSVQIAQDVISISSDAEGAEKFRGSGAGE